MTPIQYFLGPKMSRADRASPEKISEGAKKCGYDVTEYLAIRPLTELAIQLGWKIYPHRAVAFERNTYFWWPGKGHHYHIFYLPPHRPFSLRGGGSADIVMPYIPCGEDGMKANYTGMILTSEDGLGKWQGTELMPCCGCIDAMKEKVKKVMGRVDGNE